MSENSCIIGVVQEGLSLSTPSASRYTRSIEGLVNMIVLNMNDYIPKKKYKCDEGERREELLKYNPGKL